MGDDLISRKALMQKVLQEEYDNDIHKDGRAKAIHHGEYQHFYKTISEMPTAYDVDKVIEQIDGIMKDESIRFCDQAVNVAKKIRQVWRCCR